MKLVFKITKSSAIELIKHMYEMAVDDHYVHFGPARYDQLELDPLAATWHTASGKKYTVFPNLCKLEYIGSRTSLVAGAGFGSIQRSKIDKTDRFAVYLTGCSHGIHLILESMQTSWEYIPGWDDPLCTEAELSNRQSESLRQAEWNDLGFEIEEKLR